MKKITAFCLILALIFALTACAGESLVTSWGGSKPASHAHISAEIKDREVDENEAFAVEVGIGCPMRLYTVAELEIYAPGFTILLPDGTSVADVYTHEYTDFGDEKYGINYDGGKTKLKFFETYRFIHNGGEEKGSIGFSLILPPYEESKSGAGDSVSIFYTVKNGKVNVTTKRPTSGLHATLTEVKDVK